jgi:hypothetical protein
MQPCGLESRVVANYNNGEETMNLPGFTGEASLNIPIKIRHAKSTESVNVPLANYVVPAYSTACNRLLKICVNQLDPRHVACDHWLLNCF